MAVRRCSCFRLGIRRFSKGKTWHSPCMLCALYYPMSFARSRQDPDTDSAGMYPARISTCSLCRSWMPLEKRSERCTAKCLVRTARLSVHQRLRRPGRPNRSRKSWSPIKPCKPCHAWSCISWTMIKIVNAKFPTARFLGFRTRSLNSRY